MFRTPTLPKPKENHCFGFHICQNLRNTKNKKHKKYTQIKKQQKNKQQTNTTKSKHIEQKQKQTKNNNKNKKQKKTVHERNSGSSLSGDFPRDGGHPRGKQSLTGDVLRRRDFENFSCRLWSRPGLSWGQRDPKLDSKRRQIENINPTQWPSASAHCVSPARRFSALVWSYSNSLRKNCKNGGGHPYLCFFFLDWYLWFLFLKQGDGGGHIHFLKQAKEEWRWPSPLYP